MRCSALRAWENERYSSTATTSWPRSAPFAGDGALNYRDERWFSRALTKGKPGPKIKKQEQITHPFLQEKLEWGLVPYAQAMLLARFIRGDLDGYPPFMWK